MLTKSYKQQATGELNMFKIAPPSSSRPFIDFRDDQPIPLQESASASASAVATRSIAPLFSNEFKNSPSVSSFKFLGAPVQRLIYSERWLNGGSRTYSKISSYTEIQPKYQPQSEVNSYSLPQPKLPKEIVHIHTASPNAQLLANYIHEKTVLFPIHPQFYQNKEIPFMNEVVENQTDVLSTYVTPTASTRSVIVLDDKQPLHCLKLHCPAQISRFNRKLDARDIAKSVNTSRELDRAAAHEASFPAVFGYLPESIGVSIGEGEEAWGFLLREMTPRPPAPPNANRTLLPLFSLYSLDTKDTNPDKRLLLVDLIEKSNLPPTEFILDKVMLPIVESWCFMARDLGLLTQAHGQNLLLEVGEDGIPTRVIFRDLSTYMDRQARLDRGLSNSGFPLPGETTDPEHVLPSSSEAQKGYYSLVYDSFVGHHLFDYIAKAMSENYGVEKETLQAACKEKFKECFPRADHYLPAQVYYYSKDCTDGYTQTITNTGETPAWR